MPDARIRQQIALLAARLMYERTESEYYTAKRKAAKTRLNPRGCGPHCDDSPSGSVGGHPRS